jgi:hypothetical protein
MELVLGVLVLLLDIWAVLSVVECDVPAGKKIGWTVGIVLFPILGFLVWLAAGPKSRPAFI